MPTTTSNTASGTVHNYTIKRWDMLRTQMHVLSRNRVLIAFFIVMSTFVSFLDLREPEMAVRSLAFKIFFVLVFDVLFISIIVAITLVVLWVMILVRKHRAILGEHTLEVTPSGLVERTEFNETLHRWQGFHKIVRTRRYLYLWVTDSTMHTVPIRSFASEDAARVFQHEIETQIMAA